MSKVSIKREKCKGCLLCVSVCPKGVLGVEDTLNKKAVTPARVIDSNACIGCMRCAIICPDCGIEIKP